MTFKDEGKIYNGVFVTVVWAREEGEKGNQTQAQLQTVTLTDYVGAL